MESYECSNEKKEKKEKEIKGAQIIKFNIKEENVLCCLWSINWIYFSDSGEVSNSAINKGSNFLA